MYMEPQTQLHLFPDWLYDILNVSDKMFKSNEAEVTVHYLYTSNKYLQYVEKYI